MRFNSKELTQNVFEESHEPGKEYRTKQPSGSLPTQKHDLQEAESSGSYQIASLNNDRPAFIFSVVTATAGRVKSKEFHLQNANKTT